MRAVACGGLKGEEGDTRRAYRGGEAEQMRIFGCGGERGGVGDGGTAGVGGQEGLEKGGNDLAERQAMKKVSKTKRGSDGKRQERVVGIMRDKRDTWI